MLPLYGQIIAISLPMVVGLVQGIFAWKSMKSKWCNNLIKAPFHPPAFIVFITFILMNGLMGYASVRLCNQFHASKVTSEATHRHDQQIKLSLIAYLVQFTMNGIWPMLFFIAKKPTLALIQIIILDASVLFCVKLFYFLDEISGYLIIPHMIWTFWWTILLYSIWLLNHNNSLTLHEQMLSQDKSCRNNRRSQYQPLNGQRDHAVTTYGVFI